MNFAEYQKRALATDLYADNDDKSLMSKAFMLKVLGLVGESGEFAEKVKKSIRNEGGLGDKQSELLAQELGDVLWYINSLANYLGYDLEEVAEKNLLKLEDRQKRNKIASAGDER